MLILSACSGGGDKGLDIHSEDDDKKEIQQNAPKNTGDYAKSWAVKKTKESSEKLEVTVHSKNRYQLAHLLEYGHALRNGGRAKAQPHIAPAEEKGVGELEKSIERSLSHG